VNPSGVDVAAPEVTFDVIGFGALNVDYIASASKLSRRLADRVSESVSRFEGNNESRATEAAILEVIDQLGSSSLEAALGGSAWNTIFTLAQMAVGIRLGYVGVLGQIGMMGLSFTHQMDIFGIDRRWVARLPHRPCGMCLSYIDDGERVLLTSPGANLDMNRYLTDHHDEIAAYLAGSRMVHVTSFLDSETPVRQWEVLAAAKRLNPALRISFDPGHEWATKPSEPVLGILRLADYIFLNFREFRSLGVYSAGQPDGDVARRLLTRCGPGATVFVTKRYDFIEVFQDRAATMAAERFQLSLPPGSEHFLEDATGAGDVFAGAVLAAVTSKDIQLELGSLIGLSLARHKLVHAALPSIGDGFLRMGENLAPGPVRPRGVFVSHGSSPQWIAVRDFIENECGIPVFDLGPHDGGQSISGAIRDVLDRCSFAICVLSADSQTVSGAGRADQDIVHQAGVFQGRYGFDRVALLVEDGCEVFSNAAGLIRMSFPRGHVEATFLDVERMLVREGLLRKGVPG
jgi:sugar/nucleoside kinase (ribokinase family)